MSIDEGFSGDFEAQIFGKPATTDQLDDFDALLVGAVNHIPVVAFQHVVLDLEDDMGITCAKLELQHTWPASDSDIPSLVAAKVAVDERPNPIAKIVFGRETGINNILLTPKTEHMTTSILDGFAEAADDRRLSIVAGTLAELVRFVLDYAETPNHPEILAGLRELEFMDKAAVLIRHLIQESDEPCVLVQSGNYETPFGFPLSILRQLPVDPAALPPEKASLMPHLTLEYDDLGRLLGYEYLSHKDGVRSLEVHKRDAAPSLIQTFADSDEEDEALVEAAVKHRLPRADDVELLSEVLTATIAAQDGYDFDIL